MENNQSEPEFSVKAWAFKVAILVTAFSLICLYMWNEKKALKEKPFRPKFVIPATR